MLYYFSYNLHVLITALHEYLAKTSFIPWTRHPPKISRCENMCCKRSIARLNGYTPRMLEHAPPSCVAQMRQTLSRGRACRSTDACAWNLDSEALLACHPLLCNPVARSISISPHHMPYVSNLARYVAYFCRNGHRRAIERYQKENATPTS